jgi:putative ABC transport system permease protein
MDTLWQDLRYGLRALAGEPTFTAAVVVTLALGVGASAAIFSICQAVLFKPLPYPAPDRIVMVWETEMREGRTSGAAPANFVDWRTRSRSFEQLAALDPFREVTLAGRREPERLNGAAVSATFFPLLGTRVALGRSFSTDDEQPGRDRVVVLSHALWQRSFGSDPAVIGASLTLNDTSFTIVGVLPRDFQLVSRAADFNGRGQFDVWMPLALNMDRLQRGTHPLRVFGRLRTNIRDAQAELDVVASTLRRDHPRTNADRGIRLVPLSEQVAAGIRTPLLMLLGAVGFLLLIACVNVANLLLTRATARRNEMAVRLALGAGRLRLARQLVTESLLLTSIAAAAGTGIAWAALTALVRRLPFDLPRTAEIGLNAEVVGVVGLVSLAAGVVFGCAPLMHGVAASASLKTGQQTPSRAQGRTQSGLVVVQIALACILLVGAGLMGRSLWALLSVSPGFEADRVLTARLALTSRLYSDVRRIATFQRELLARVNRLPGARSAGFGGYLPLGGSGNSWAPAIEGRAPLSPGERIEYRPVTPGYIESLAIPLVEGRLLTDADREDAPAVAIVNLAAARRYWPNESPIGRRLQIDGGPPWRTVIGVVGDVRHQGLDAAAQPELYIPFAQTPYPNSTMTLVVRTSSDPRTFATRVKEVLAAIDPNLPLTRVQTMDDVLRGSVGAPRFRALLLGGFSFIALMLAAVGVYGVMSYFVTERRREFGIRAALGATRADLLRLVLGRSTPLIAAGIALGLTAGVALARIVRTLLFGVTPFDVVTLIVVSVLLTSVALVACYVPARRASRIHPVHVLRGD